MAESEPAESTLAVRVHPVTPDRWGDLEARAGERGFTSGCWCMWWRVTSKEFERRHGAGLRQELHDLVTKGPEPGLLADFAEQRGAEVVEAYPMDTGDARRSSADLYTGTLAMFERAGFVGVARRGGRPIVRRTLDVSRR